MANLKTNVTLTASQKEAVIYLTLDYVDTATESDYLLYDSSVVAALVGLADPLDSSIIAVQAAINTAATARVWLEWDATTDVTAICLPVNSSSTDLDFRHIGALPNQGGSGKTGDILLNATGLGTGDRITIVLRVRLD